MLGFLATASIDDPFGLYDATNRRGLTGGLSADARPDTSLDVYDQRIAAPHAWAGSASLGGLVVLEKVASCSPRQISPPDTSLRSHRCHDHSLRYRIVSGELPSPKFADMRNPHH
jgi:hypothetical protein